MTIERSVCGLILDSQVNLKKEVVNVKFLLSAVIKDVLLVINPVAAGGRVETIWRDQIKPLVDNYDLEYDFEFTSSPQHVIEIVRSRVSILLGNTSSSND